MERAPKKLNTSLPTLALRVGSTKTYGADGEELKKLAHPSYVMGRADIRVGDEEGAGIFAFQPLEIILEICEYMFAGDCLRLGMTCRWMWNLVFERYVHLGNTRSFISSMDNLLIAGPHDNTEFGAIIPAYMRDMINTGAYTSPKYQVIKWFKLRHWFVDDYPDCLIPILSLFLNQVDCSPAETSKFFDTPRKLNYGTAVSALLIEKEEFIWQIIDRVVVQPTHLAELASYLASTWNIFRASTTWGSEERASAMYDVKRSRLIGLFRLFTKKLSLMQADFAPYVDTISATGTLSRLWTSDGPGRKHIDKAIATAFNGFAGLMGADYYTFYKSKVVYADFHDKIWLDYRTMLECAVDDDNAEMVKCLYDDKTSGLQPWDLVSLLSMRIRGMRYEEFDSSPRFIQLWASVKEIVADYICIAGVDADGLLQGLFSIGFGSSTHYNVMPPSIETMLHPSIYFEKQKENGDNISRGILRMAINMWKSLDRETYWEASYYRIRSDYVKDLIKKDSCQYSRLHIKLELAFTLLLWCRDQVKACMREHDQLVAATLGLICGLDIDFKEFVIKADNTFLYLGVRYSFDGRVARYHDMSVYTILMDMCPYMDTRSPHIDSFPETQVAVCNIFEAFPISDVDLAFNHLLVAATIGCSEFINTIPRATDLEKALGPEEYFGFVSGIRNRAQAIYDHRSLLNDRKLSHIPNYLKRNQETLVLLNLNVEPECAIPVFNGIFPKRGVQQIITMPLIPSYGSKWSKLDQAVYLMGSI
jgi:hypothetical protein